jgi:hypothetical protein
MKGTINPFKLSLAALLLGAALLTPVAINVRAAIVSLTASDANGATTSFNGAGHWSNAQAPNSTNDYLPPVFCCGHRTPPPAVPTISPAIR